MLTFLKKLLPTKEDSDKLRFEFWKVLIFAGVPLLLAILGITIPTFRKWIGETFSATGTLLGQLHEVSGWTISVGVFGVIWTAGSIGLFFWRRRLPAFTRDFREGHYDGIRWKWAWESEMVRQGSLTPFCVECGTELIIKPKRDQYDATHTSIFCTGCNKPWAFSHVSDLRDHIRRKIERDARNGTRPENPPAEQVSDGPRGALQRPRGAVPGGSGLDLPLRPALERDPPAQAG